MGEKEGKGEEGRFEKGKTWTDALWFWGFHVQTIAVTSSGLLVLMMYVFGGIDILTVWVVIAPTVLVTYVLYRLWKRMEPGSMDPDGWGPDCWD